MFIYIYINLRYKLYYNMIYSYMGLSISVCESLEYTKLKPTFITKTIFWLRTLLSKMLAFEKACRGRLKGKKLLKKVSTKAPKKLIRWVPQLCIVVTTGMMEPAMGVMRKDAGHLTSDILTLLLSCHHCNEWLREFSFPPPLLVSLSPWLICTQWYS